MKFLFNIVLFLMSYSLFSSSPVDNSSPDGQDEIEIIFADSLETPRSGFDDEGTSSARALSRAGSDTPSRRPSSRLSAATPTRSPSRPLREASPVVSDLLDVTSEELPQLKLRYIREEDYPTFKEILDLFSELKEAENAAKDGSENHLANLIQKYFDLDMKIIKLADGDIETLRNIILELDFLGSEEIINRINFIYSEYPYNKVLKNILDADLESENVNVARLLQESVQREHDYNLKLLVDAIIKKIRSDKEFPHLKEAFDKGLEGLKTVEEFRNYLFSSASAGGAPLLNILTVDSLDLTGESDDILPGQLQVISDKEMTLLPEEVSNLLLLKNLNLSNQRIRELDASILPESLETLNVSSNKLIKLSIKGLPNLKTLIVDYNEITDVELEDLPKLETLSLVGNQIETIPNLNNLTNLKYLNIDFNNFKELNLNLPNLEYLYVEDNYELERLSLNTPKLKAENISSLNSPVQIVTS